MSTLENQLWLWLDECDSQKPRVSKDVSQPGDKVVRLLQEGTVRGREASEDGDPAGLSSSKLQ